VVESEILVICIRNTLAAKKENNCDRQLSVIMERALPADYFYQYLCLELCLDNFSMACKVLIKADTC